MTVMTQDDILSKCWHNPRNRNCSLCRAYHKREGGSCCFGLRYESGDRICGDCPHMLDCRKIVMGYPTPNRPASRPVVVPKRSAKPPGALDGERLVAPDVEQGDESRELTLSHMVHRGWYGGLEGAFELILGTLRYRRPPP